MRRTWTRALAIAACLGTAVAHDVAPPLPFATNPAPDPCGIPVPMGAGYEGRSDATFDGVVQEELAHLVDSRVRAAVTGHGPAGSA